MRFAHDSERLFAELLDYYEVRWEYEPVEFVLSWGTGRAADERFPAGLLPERPRPVPRADDASPGARDVKNRKLRQMAELYPEVQVRVLYRRDVFSLLGKYLPEATSRLAG